MNTDFDPLSEILRRHGVEDAATYLLTKGENAGIKSSDDPDVVARGSIHLIKKQMVSRQDVDLGMGELKFL